MKNYTSYINRGWQQGWKNDETTCIAIHIRDTPALLRITYESARESVAREESRRVAGARLRVALQRWATETTQHSFILELFYTALVRADVEAIASHYCGLQVERSEDNS